MNPQPADYKSAALPLSYASKSEADSSTPLQLESRPIRKGPPDAQGGKIRQLTEWGRHYGGTSAPPHCAPPRRPQIQLLLSMQPCIVGQSGRRRSAAWNKGCKPLHGLSTGRSPHGGSEGVGEGRCDPAGRDIECDLKKTSRAAISSAKAQPTLPCLPRRKHRAKTWAPQTQSAVRERRGSWRATGTRS